RLQVGLGVGAVEVEALLQLPVARRAAGEAAQLAAPDVPEDVQHPQPVLPGGVSGPVFGPRAGGAVDVRDVVGVAPDRHVAAPARAVPALHLPGRNTEGGGVEEVPEGG